MQQVAAQNRIEDLCFYKVKTRGSYATHGTKQCTLPISVGQEYHEDNKFLSLYKWAQQHFDNVQIIVTDTLQRHNIMFSDEVDEAEAIERALIKGQEWINKNASFVSKEKIILWDDLLNLPGVAEYQEKINAVFDTNIEYRHEIETAIRAIYLRMNKNNPEKYSLDKFKDFYHFSKTYILEETAVRSALETTLEGGYFYPGSKTVQHLLNKDGVLVAEAKCMPINLCRYKNPLFAGTNQIAA